MRRSENLRPYLWTLVLIWTAGIGASLTWNISQLSESMMNIARTSARIAFEKDVIYRLWAADHGGVYVPVSKTTPPNPYLTVPHRDVTTSDGLELTLINPAYMTRQVNELALTRSGYRGHITSLKPIRPENHPDPWEIESLRAFERGTPEVGSLETMSGKEYFRFMKPFRAEKSCLICHEQQGYKEGDLRGGISVSIPMEPLRAIEQTRRRQLFLAHVFLWIFGLAGIGAGTRPLRRQVREREKREEELRAMAITDQLTGLHNRRGFLTLAGQQIKLCDRTRKGAILLYADLDGMKQINDSLGHEAGDRALIEVAAALQKVFRSSDIMARMGGDEFAVLAIDTTEDNIDIHLTRLRDWIDSRNNRENAEFKLALSVGYSFYDPAKPCSIDALMALADRRMYEQKKSKTI